MRTLLGVLKASELDSVNEKTSLRFKDVTQFKTPEALIVYEQGMLPEDKLLSLCEEEYGKSLCIPRTAYIPKDLLDKFFDKDCVPLSYDVGSNTMRVGVLPEFEDRLIMCDNMNIEKVLVPIYFYVSLYTTLYGQPSFLYELPIKDKWSFIVEEAVSIGASDITVTNVASGAQVYYNRKKTKVHSRRALTDNDVKEIAKLLATEAGETSSGTTRKPKYLSVRLDMHNRGRVVINSTYYGHSITIRVLPDALLAKSLEDLNLSPSTCSFIRDHVLSKEKGLRLFIGETMSGKNTTILSALLELVAQDKYKIVSVEQPVELLVDGIEQIDAETDEEFEQNADSLLRQNPDIVYFTEITARTAESIIKQSNTSKAVFTSVHANSISDVISRLQDITNATTDRLILTLQSCVYQELVRDEDKDEIYPVNRCVYFSDELKMKLYGKSIAEIKTILQEVENQWH